MAEKTFGREWTKKNTCVSVVLFFVHFIIWVAIAAGFLCFRDDVGIVPWPTHFAVFF